MGSALSSPHDGAGGYRMIVRASCMALAALLLMSALAADPRITSADPTGDSASVNTATGVSAPVHLAATHRRSRARRVRRLRRPPVGGVYARCAVVFDPVTGQVLFDKNAERSAPIASITKLMTA